ncbi:hypothetical protein ACNKHP_04370 [Shigella boydii]
MGIADARFTMLYVPDILCRHSCYFRQRESPQTSGKMAQRIVFRSSPQHHQFLMLTSYLRIANVDNFTVSDFRVFDNAV